MHEQNKNPQTTHGSEQSEGDEFKLGFNINLNL